VTLDRRGFVVGGLSTCLLAGGCVRPLSESLDNVGRTIEDGLAKVDPPEFSPAGRFEAQLRMIEGRADGLLGVAMFDSSSGNSAGLNADRRFPHCSSFKLSLAAMVLAQDANGAIDAGRRVRWGERDLLAVSPLTSQRVDEGASLLELAEATQKLSDNAAANILLRELGGPAALTRFWRSIGDEHSRLDRTEPALNNVPVTELRDTTTPAAMARNVARLVYGDVLPFEARQTLRQWMIDTQTGARRVRAGLPAGWVGGDKTGTSLWPGLGSIYVDIGFVEVPEDAKEWRAPLTFAAYFRSNAAHERIDPAAEEALAKVGKQIADFAELDDWWPV
jgi:beta-lactamase class A